MFILLSFMVSVYGFKQPTVSVYTKFVIIGKSLLNTKVPILDGSSFLCFNKDHVTLKILIS